MESRTNRQSKSPRVQKHREERREKEKQKRKKRESGDEAGLHGIDRCTVAVSTLSRQRRVKRQNMKVE